MKQWLTFWIFILTFIVVNGQDDNFNYTNDVYVDYIKSVEFGLENANLSQPIINLNATAKLMLKFDDVSNESRNFYYDIIHCDRNWNRSDMDNLDYIDGFTEEDIRNVEYSVNTFVEYAQYTLTLPNDDIKWTLSGNYILVVYEEGDTNFPVITRRFMVVDSRVRIIPQYQRPSDITKFDSHQEFDFEVDFKNFPLQDPLSTISAVVLQNYRWDNAIFDINPRFINRDRLVYNYNNKICFPGLKEYRFFDTRTLRSTKIGVNAIELNEDGNDVLLDLHENRFYKRYLNDNDANGQRIMYTEDRRDPLLSADYTNVVFVLDSPKEEYEIYVVGAFNDYKPKEEHRMQYSEQREAYVGEIFLKQGYYDFMYALNKEGKLDLSAMEGSWFETENDYTILIYYSTLFDRYDQLIGITSFNSNDF